MTSPWKDACVASGWRCKQPAPIWAAAGSPKPGLRSMVRPLVPARPPIQGFLWSLHLLLPPSWPRRHLGWRYVLAENHLSFACSLCLAPQVPKSLVVWLLKQLLPGQRAHHPNPPTMGTVLSFSPRLVIHHLLATSASLFIIFLAS